ncbi:hypothetical protein AB0M00_31430 [Streptomyces chartreusis]|uniref:hypothetical protein n=1 Tax=Streptomyces chartreusis TaxID=1969 RepID=UPI0034276F82
MHEYVAAPPMSSAEYRYAVFLTQDDWKTAMAGYMKRVKRFRAAARLDQCGRVSDALIGAEADSYPVKDERKYVLYLSEDDYDFFWEAVVSRWSGIPRDVVKRITHELSGAAGDATEL